MTARPRPALITAVASLGFLIPLLLAVGAVPPVDASAFSKRVEAGVRPSTAKLAPWQQSLVDAVQAPLRTEGVSGPTGNWERMPPPTVTEAGVVYDAARQRLLVFGGRDGETSNNDLWELTLTGTPTWTLLSVTGTRPSARSGHGMLYDPVRDRLLLFGGRDATDALENDVWALPLGVLPLTWAEGSPAGPAPAPRAYMSGAYDATNDRVVIFGGGLTMSDQGPTDLVNDVWSLPLNAPLAWTELAPAGTPPAPRAGSIAVYDATRGRIVFHAGYDGSLLSDTWTLSLGGSPQWTQLAPTGGPPAPRAVGAALYDPPNDRMVMYGGIGGVDADEYLADIWSLALATPAWTELSPAGTAPTPRDFPGGAYDSNGRRLIIYGGRDSSGGTIPDVACAMNLDGPPIWSAIAPVPTSRDRGASVLDPAGNRLLIHGGADRTGGLGDLWVFTLADRRWNSITSFPLGSPVPGARSGHSAVYDLVRRRMVVFGGTQGSDFNEVWTLALNGTLEWSYPSTSGGPPTARSGHSAVYDSRRDRMIIYGGSTAASLQLRDAWALDFATNTWSLLNDGNSGATPGPRSLHAAVYDDNNDRMLVFSGPGSTDDLWQLSLAGSPTWTEIGAAGPHLAARHGAIAVYDTSADCMLLFSGSSNGGGQLDDTWLLYTDGGAAWDSVQSTGARPRGREQMMGGYDQATGRLVLFGGSEFSTRPLSDTWVLTFDRSTPVLGSMIRSSARTDRIELSWWLPSARTRVRIERRESTTDWRLVASRDADASGLLEFVDANVVAGRRYAYRLIGSNGAALTREEWVTVPFGTGLELAGLIPNPARDGALIVFTLPSASPARIALLDLAGRQVFAREIGNLGAGRHQISLGESKLPPGVYLVRLSVQSGGEVTRRAVILD